MLASLAIADPSNSAQRVLAYLVQACEASKSDAHLVGRANAGLASVLRAVCQPGSAVVFPALLCPSPVLTASSLGFRPLFCDVRTSDYTMDLRALEELLDSRDDIGAVLVAHLYGHAAQVDAMAELCCARGVVLINDAAQAFGGEDRSGRSLASYGDVALLSFGHTKILDAGGGGALLVHNPELRHRIAEEVGKLPPPPSCLPAAGKAYQRLYYAIREAAVDHAPVLSMYEGLATSFSEIFAYRFAGQVQADRIESGIAQLASNIDTRRANARMLRHLLRDAAVEHPEIDLHRVVPWRYSFCVDQRDALAEALRARGFDASPWYPALPSWFASGRAQTQSFANAQRIGERILNLWVTPGSDPVALASAIIEIQELERTGRLDT